MRSGVWVMCLVVAPLCFITVEMWYVPNSGGLLVTEIWGLEIPRGVSLLVGRV